MTAAHYYWIVRHDNAARRTGVMNWIELAFTRCNTRLIDLPSSRVSHERFGGGTLY